MGSDLRPLLVSMLVILVGLILVAPVITNAVTATTTTGIGSFAGLAAVVGLVPIGFGLLIAWNVYKRMK